MGIFWLVVYAYAVIVISSVFAGIPAGKIKQFWAFLTGISDRLLKRRWDEYFSSTYKI